MFTGLQGDVEDLDGLAEMAEEDASLQGEVDEQIASVEERLATLEEQRLFSGPLRLRRRACDGERGRRAAPTPRTGRRWCCGC